MIPSLHQDLTGKDNIINHNSYDKTPDSYTLRDRFKMANSDTQKCRKSLLCTSLSDKPVLNSTNMPFFHL